MISFGELKHWHQRNRVTSVLTTIGAVVMALVTLTGAFRALKEAIARQEPIAGLKLGRLEDLSFPASQISAEAIMAEIDAARQFQATKEVAQYFKGAKVDWTLPLASVDEQEGGLSRMTLQSAGAYTTGIVVVTMLTKDLHAFSSKLPSSNTPVHVRGTIKSADNSSVTLTDASLVQ